ncbi:trypsin domain-containing protein [Ditylenchus destructor]|uniref:Trypsin domain-containing protein n=1 Tax=Ditylenchus destructor TaxID=166010 RepID=A0AAD4N4I7_9BILA|nr:trypsin domain-containing protein [Ditylenchus destructor]
MATISFLGLSVILATLTLMTSAPFEELQCDHTRRRSSTGKISLASGIGSSSFDPDQEKMMITIGSVSIHDGQKIRVKRIIPYNNHSFLPNDIGIIELEEDLSFSKDIRPICLSGKHQVGDPDKNVVITGWGDITGYGAYPNTLREGTARVVKDEKCERYGADYTPETLICIGSHSGTAPWRGDSGGPALLHEGKRWTQIGITSYGMAHKDGSADLTWPSVYARISHFCDWIAENTNNEAKCDD